MISRQVQIRRGTTTENASFTGAQGELTFDTTANVLILHDGFTIGGHRLDAASLPIASPTQLGGIKIGTGLSIDGNGVVASTATYSLPTATASVLGGIKIGTGLYIDPQGVVSTVDVDTSYAQLAGAVFTGNISAPNLSGNNTGDQNLAPYALLAGAAFTGNITAFNLSGTNTGDQNLAPYALLTGATFTGNVLAPNVNVTGIQFSDNTYQTTATITYVLPIASAGSLGGIKVGPSLEISGGGILDVANNLTVSGNIAAANLSGTNTGDQNLAPYALLSGATFSGAISATNFSGNTSGTNTGDQNLAPYALNANLASYALLAGATFSGPITATNFSGNSSGVNTGDQNLSGYAQLSGAIFTGSIDALNFSGNSSGTNTGDQNLSFFANTATGATFVGNIEALNFSGNSSGVNTGDQNLSGYAQLSGATFTGNVTAANVNVSSGGVIKFGDNTEQVTASTGSVNVYDSVGTKSDSAIYTGTATLSGITGVTINLPSPYSNTNYKIQLSYNGTGGFNASNVGSIWSNTVSSSQFTIHSANTNDSNNVNWTTFGSNI